MASTFNQSQILLHDYGVGGAVTQDVRMQINDRFLPYAGKQPDWVPWKSNNTLFGIRLPSISLTVVTFVGINDVSKNLDVTTQMSLYFSLQSSLYQGGARNFVFYGVPPFDRTAFGTIPHPPPPSFPLNT